MIKQTLIIKYGVLCVALVLVAALLFYLYQVDSLYNVLPDNFDENKIDHIEVSAFVTVHGNVEFEIDNSQKIQEMLALLETIKVRRTYINHIFSPKLYATYRITILDKKALDLGHIQIFDKNYLSVCGKNYRITSSSGLKQIYELANE